jgi:hypothetical protein
LVTGALYVDEVGNDGTMKATDGCGPVEDDGRCEHGGAASLMRSIGLAPQQIQRLTNLLLTPVWPQGAAVSRTGLV